MQSKFFIIFLLATVLLSACEDKTATDMGAVLQTEADKITLGTETFNLETDNEIISSMVSRPDSFLLGTYIDKHFGTTNADFFMQVESPLNFPYPAGAVPDSAELVLQYFSWFGYKYSPMEVSVYLMDQNKTFDFNSTYYSDIKVEDYTSKSNLIGRKSFTAKDALFLKTDSTAIKMKLSDDFVNNKFNAVLTDTIPNLNSFLKFFPGLYVTSNFGSASMLHISTAVLRYHFHYYFQENGKSVKANAYINYPANSWVRQVNRVNHPDAAIISQKLDETDTVNFISSPAHIYTSINLPIARIKDKINNVHNKKLNINSAQLRLDITQLEEMSDAQRVPEYLLILRDTATDSYKEFFQKRKLPNSTTSVLAQYARGKDKITGETAFYYTFDMAMLIKNELNNNSNANVKYIVVPVAVKKNSSGSIIEVKEQNLMRSVSICSGNNSKRPMKLDLIYSLF